MGQDRPYHTGRGPRSNRSDRPDGLVRPYVLPTGGQEDRPLPEEPAQAAAHGGPRSDDLFDDLARERDAYETGSLGARLQQGAAGWLSTGELSADRSAGNHRDDGRRPGPEGGRGGHRR